MNLRRYPRISVNLPARTRRAGVAGEAGLSIRQLSLGGCLLCGKEEGGDGRAVWISFRAKEKEIRIIAKIRYEYSKNGECCWGAVFSDIPTSHFQHLKTYISEHLQNGGEVIPEEGLPAQLIA